MATYKMVLIYERNNVSPSPALNEPDSLAADLTDQLNAALTAAGAGTTVDQYQYGGAQAGGRRHYFLLSTP